MKGGDLLVFLWEENNNQTGKNRATAAVLEISLNNMAVLSNFTASSLPVPLLGQSNAKTNRAGILSK